MRADLQVRLAPAARVFEKTIFGRFFQMRANSSSYSAADGFSSAVSQYTISS